MNDIAGYSFPETQEECNGWKPYVLRVALNRDVLAVAKTRIEGQWGAYIGAVSGANHDDEQEQVLREGGKLSPEVARVLFPQFACIPYAR